MGRLVSIAVICALVATASAQGFPDAISLCGRGSCKTVGVIKDVNGVAIAIGPVSADANPGAPGDYPADFSICGLGSCVVVPVVKMDPAQPDPVPMPGACVTSTCPASVGVCKDGSCKVVPVNKDKQGVAVSVGPVPSWEPHGASSSYPATVGVCCHGVCKALPVLTKPAIRKLR